ncbi:hypothetical protein FALBO_3929 [Fusarium albosuccineum]|uniref:Uncharacterized protein n=1 Tax=Fusarium albosuccineum TaxID=1237068 RepID=A0A8H4LHI9_9HYPO|nr:hypothetical protein FALBO_3929 [Fusarium albosuccineum]
MSTPREYWGLSCPDSGKFYICEDDETQFVGCCLSDPCGNNNGTCPDGDLRATTFDKDKYEDLPTQDCDNSQGIDNYYTCKFNSPPFFGCCSQNACAEGECPRNRLVPAKLSKNANLREDFLNPRVESTSASGSAASTTATSSSTATAAAGSSDDDAGLSTGATAGIAVGASVGGLLLLALLAWLFWWKPRQKKNGEQFQSVPRGPPMTQDQYGQDHYQHPQPDTPGAFTTQPTFPAQSPMSNYQPSFASTPVVGQHYPSGVSSMDQYKGYSPQTAQFERPQSYGHFSENGSVQPHSPGLPTYNQSYGNPQMMPVQEMDGTTTVAHEMSAGDEHHAPQPHSPNPDNQNQGHGLGVSR